MAEIKGIRAFADKVADYIAEELEVQGHVIDPNGLAGDIEQKIIQRAGSVELQFWMRHYAKYVEMGVPAEKIKHKFAPARIKGLTSFVERRGIASGKEAKGIAYAIAQKHADYGMPTAKSRKHSQTGRRTGFLEAMAKRHSGDIDDALLILFGDMIDNDMVNIIRENNAKGNN